MRRLCTESSRSYLGRSAPRAVQLDEDQTRIGSTRIPRPKRRNVLPACFKQERTACVNRIRGLLAEFGVVVAQSPKVLREVLSEVLEDAGNELSGLARLVIQRAPSPMARTR